MGAGDLEQKTIRHSSWDEGEEVIVRAPLYGENLDMLAACTIKHADKDDELDNAKFANMTLKTCIVSWTLTKGGKIMKLNGDFRPIKGHVVTFIMTEIEGFNPKPDTDFPAETGEGAQREGELSAGDGTGNNSK